MPAIGKGKAMAITVRKITLWRKEVENRPGALAAVLSPLADAGADFDVVMATSLPGAEEMATIGVFPLQGRKALAAARAAGLKIAASMPSLLVSGDDAPGLGHRLAQTIADAGINVGFVMALRLGQNFSSVFGFDNDQAAMEAARLIRRFAGREARVAAGPKKARSGAKPAAKTKSRSGTAGAPATRTTAKKKAAKAGDKSGGKQSRSNKSSPPPAGRGTRAGAAMTKPA